MGSRGRFFGIEAGMLPHLQARLAQGRTRIASQVELIRMLEMIGQPTATSIRALDAMQSHQQQLQAQHDFIESMLALDASPRGL